MKKIYLMMTLVCMVMVSCKPDGGEEGNEGEGYLGGYVNGHEYVDLGLPSGIKWATCNIGAASPEEYGDYYAWGDTATKSEYTEDNCSTYELSFSHLQSQGYIDSEGNLTAQYDAARANWGGNWRMPTCAELEELITKCTWNWTIRNGVNGYKVTGPSGASIFLPAAGVRYDSSFDAVGGLAYYWSTTPNESNAKSAYDLFFYSISREIGNYRRNYGQSVRPVVE